MLRKNHIGIHAAPRSAITRFPAVRFGAQKIESGMSGDLRKRWISPNARNRAPLIASWNVVSAPVLAGSFAVTIA